MKSELEYELVRLKNGAQSVRSLSMGETFHPVIGPELEAEALYVRQLRLPERISQPVKNLHSPFVIWDIGLGAAANVLTAFKQTRTVKSSLHVISFDRTLAALEFAYHHRAAFPYFESYENAVSQMLDQKRAAFKNGDQTVVWEARLGDFSKLAGTEGASWPKPSAIFYDPFSPAKNPEMYDQQMINRLFQLLDQNVSCSLANYSRSTFFRVTLLLAGLFAGHGEATGEKEETTIAANDLALIERPLNRDWLFRANRSTSAEPLRGGKYRQDKLSAMNWEKLKSHPQFQET